MTEVECLGNLVLANGGDPRVQVANLVRLVHTEDRTSSFKQYTLKLQNGNSVRVFHAPDFSRAAGRRLSERVFITKCGFNDLAFFLLRATRNGVYFRADPCSAKVALNLSVEGIGLCEDAEQSQIIKLIVAAIAAEEWDVRVAAPRVKAAVEVGGCGVSGGSKSAKVVDPAAPSRTWKILVLDPTTFNPAGNLPELYTDEEEARKAMGKRALTQPNALFVKVEFQERVQAKLALSWS